MTDLSGSLVRGNSAGRVTSFMGNRARISVQSSKGVLRGICLGGLTGIDGDTSLGRHLQVGVTQSIVEGSPSPPSLQLTIPGFWRFRWVITPGQRRISVYTKQNSTGSYRPSLVVKANSSVGIANDLSGSAPDGTGWQTIGPIVFTATGTGVVWVELHNNEIGMYNNLFPAVAYNNPAYFDHIVTT